MSDLVAVMRSGTIIQHAAPHEVYTQPADRWVARFLGDAESLAGVAEGEHVDTDIGRLRLAEPATGRVDVLIRPEQVHLNPSANGSSRVVGAEFYGHDQLVMVELPDGRRLLSRLGPSPVLHPGDTVDVEIDRVVAFPVD